jgi:excisionase family DNA binding protein
LRFFRFGDRFLKEEVAVMSSVQEQTVLPPKNAEALAEVEQILRSDERVVLAVGDKNAVLPTELRDVITNVVMALRRGQAITLPPHALRLTTQQAADLLGISRPTLIKLLEGGQIPYETPNRHRRIQLSDLLTYQSTRRSERRDTLRDLAREAQELGTYDTSPEEYQAALAEARKKFA